MDPTFSNPSGAPNHGQGFRIDTNNHSGSNTNNGTNLTQSLPKPVLQSNLPLVNHPSISSSQTIGVRNSNNVGMVTNPTYPDTYDTSTDPLQEEAKESMMMDIDDDDDDDEPLSYANTFGSTEPSSTSIHHPDKSNHSLPFQGGTTTAEATTTGKIASTPNATTERTTPTTTNSQPRKVEKPQSSKDDPTKTTTFSHALAITKQDEQVPTTATNSQQKEPTEQQLPKDDSTTRTFTHALFAKKIQEEQISTTTSTTATTDSQQTFKDDSTNLTHALFGDKKTQEIALVPTTTTANTNSQQPPQKEPPLGQSLPKDDSTTTTLTHALFGAKKTQEIVQVSSTSTTATSTKAQAEQLPNTTNITAQANEPLKVPPSEPVIPKEQPPDKIEKPKDEFKQDDEDIEILTKKQAEKEWRRKRKRQLQKQLDSDATTPSFVAILEGPIEIAEDEEEPQESKDGDVRITKIVVNVDEYLHLGDFRKTTTVLPNTVSSRSSSSSLAPPTPVPSSIVSASPVTSADPKEEGYYEGAKLMAMPEDETYLSDMQQWVRQNLEFFSATDLDAQMSQSGRRQRTVRGKVGVRCVHCARALLPKFTSKLNTNAIKYEQWPPGSVSYPATMDGLYSSCSQRPQLHFKTCPHMSAAMRMQGSQWLSGEGEMPTKRRKRCREGVSALMYYHIACERIGLVETPGGLRFTRDLNLEPLPLEQAKHKIEETKPELLVKPRQRQVSYQPMAAPSSSQVKMEKTPCTNEECQQILQEALQEEDDLSVRLACKVDNEMVSDYTFLAIKQMALCHASPLDFVSRGKKTKLMRLGFAGFCCRHCDAKNNVTHACRSYSSAPDNLASAISNSFVLHLAKCPNTPNKIKQALVTLKKLHSKQMQQLPYGSQRKCFMELWRRMRASDKIVQGQENPTPEQIAEASAVAGISTSLPDSVRSTSVETAIESNRKNARSNGFPVSSNENTLTVLKKAEEDWDPPKDNDGLLDKDDRFLVSDYVFLTMRQLQQALPTSADFRGNRRQSSMQRMAGMKCSHCKDHAFVGSGRSFPSAPDNMASAFNTSLYNHMQACPGVPVELKGALYDLRKIHSMQCQNLVFGSQRKFFNKVFAKLKKVLIPQSVLEALPPIQSPTKRPPSYGKSSYGASSYEAIPTATDEILKKNSYVIGPALDGFPVFYQCQRCRAVPLVFRAPGCVQYSRPTTHVVVKHAMACQGDGIYMGFVKKAFDELTEDFEFISQLAPFRDLVRHVVGNHNDLAELFSNPEAEVKKDTSGSWRRLPATVDFDQAQKLFENMASELKIESERLEDQPKLLRYLQTISPSFQLPLPAAQKDDKKGEDSKQNTNLIGDIKEASVNGDTPKADSDVTMKDSSTTSKSEVASSIGSTQPAGTPMANAKPDMMLSTTHIKSPVAASSGEEKEIVDSDSSDEEGIMV